MNGYRSILGFMDNAGNVHRATDSVRYNVDLDLTWIEMIDVLSTEVVAMHNARLVRVIYYRQWFPPRATKTSNT